MEKLFSLEQKLDYLLPKVVSLTWLGFNIELKSNPN